ncbi:peroxiredoxin-like family protein [Flavivirga rizhaonensis]|uniref:thioredoxin-dependent peroxiredoxin n=1 Tax=Flavivirga rizhaonensis TaxID=2559571 RepID=A0A4S1DTG6_9FLAO|nr:peroxiredoxin-like family protein [Flavivirga rizhaonensis]TGV01316.1 AhpC/TSA family protein [Flavivirga rizhaonensis]
MTLKEQLSHISETGFSRMPKHIAQVLLDGVEEIASSDLKDKALKVGEKVTNAEFVDIFGTTRKLSEFMEQEYLVLNFYRGGWCPYCNMELRRYEMLKEEFERHGANIVAISAEKPNISAQTSDKNTLSFPLLSDNNATFMKSLGIVFTLNNDLKREYANFGIDLTQIHGNLNFELPVPGVYIINKDFEIVYVHLDENYMTRPEPSEILDTLTSKIMQKNTTLI